MPIQILAPEVASQIAAGEVVERPASVVKELLENTLDAGAGKVSVRIEQAGQRLIEVEDDGSGIPAGEMELAVERHATSKLRKADDLFHIQTLGFRGEALASIGSVSRLTITSRGKDAETGKRLMVEGGSNHAPEIIGCPVGTLVRVEDLFYNVPARLKFLKKDSTERQQIDGLLTRYALAYPQVRFSLVQDGSRALQTTGSGSRRETLAALYGVDIARQMLEVSLEETAMQVHGFTSPVGLTRSNRKEITFFVNGRWVSDGSLNSALLRAYHTYLMVGRYPLTVLFIDMDPELVDVNVHPAKAEVRFRHPEQLFSLVQRSVRRALLAYAPAPLISVPTWHTSPSLPETQPHQYGINLDWQMAADVSAEDRPELPVPQQPDAPLDTDIALPDPPVGMQHYEPPSISSGQMPILRGLGQLGNTYIVAEGPDGLYLIDQHAAHERILFERMLKQIGKQIPSQRLLQGVSFVLPPRHARLLAEQLTFLNRLGFEVEEFGVDTFRVSAVPALLGKMDPAAAVRVVVEDFEEDETPLQSRIEDRLVARICKRVAVKGGQTLSNEEQLALLRDLEACQSPRTCPHGRPTMIHLSVDLLERQFGRRGSR
ncbi:MAG: DNA mismatch repair endonuclease MutL [Anaerolineae bacterium]|nr:DNA mismatch repair endonuclease MutL [Anaerolineae bacterium]